MDSSWNFKRLLFCHSLIVFLISSLLIPILSDCWRVLDVAAFKFLNHTFLQTETMQRFWASMNRPFIDWVEDLIFLFLFCAHVFQAPSKERKQRLIECFFCVLFIALTIILVNRLIFRDLLVIKRLSPTLSVTSFINLSNLFPFLDFKIYSTKSFPGDHATTALLFASLFSTFARRPLGVLAVAISLFFCLPRLIVGAHWLSDILVGSASVLLFALSWAFCTPLQKWMCNSLEKLLFSKKKAKAKMIEQPSEKE